MSNLRGPMRGQRVDMVMIDDMHGSKLDDYAATAHGLQREPRPGDKMRDMLVAALAGCPRKELGIPHTGVLPDGSMVLGDSATEDAAIAADSRRVLGDMVNERQWAPLAVRKLLGRRSRRQKKGTDWSVPKNAITEKSWYARASGWPVAHNEGATTPPSGQWCRAVLACLMFDWLDYNLPLFVAHREKQKLHQQVHHGVVGNVAITRP